MSEKNQYCIKIAKNLSIVSGQKNFVLLTDWPCTKSCDLCITAPGVDLRYNVNTRTELLDLKTKNGRRRIMAPGRSELPILWAIFYQNGPSQSLDMFLCIFPTLLPTTRVKFSV